MNYNTVKYKEFYEIISEMDKNPVIQEMKKYRQHYDCSCYDHCLSVAYYSFCLCKKLKLDYTSMARAAFVHDLFLYDWRFRENNRKGLHAFTHPKAAYENASEYFKLNEKEKDIILKHMWPITIIPPKYLESYVITLVDKYCAIMESVSYYKKNNKLNKIYRYTYVFLSLLVIKIV